MFFSDASAAALSAGSFCENDSQCASGSCVELNGSKVCRDVTGEVDSKSYSFGSPTSTKTFEEFMCSATTFLAKDIIPPLAVLMTLVIGFLYLVSFGNPEKVSTANKLLFFTAIGIVLLLLSPAIVSIISGVFVGSDSDVLDCAGESSVNIITDALVSLINWFAWFLVIVSISMTLYSGFLYITSKGDPEKSSKATKIFIFAIIGVAVSILAFSIVSIVDIFI